MRCQICNRVTNNWKKNKHTGKYESICNKCQNIINSCTLQYEDFTDALIADIEEDERDFLTILKEIGEKDND